MMRRPPQAATSATSYPCEKLMNNIEPSQNPRWEPSVPFDLLIPHIHHKTCTPFLVDEYRILAKLFLCLQYYCTVLYCQWRLLSKYSPTNSKGTVHHVLQKCFNLIPALNLLMCSIDCIIRLRFTSLLCSQAHPLILPHFWTGRRSEGNWPLKRRHFHQLLCFWGGWILVWKKKG